MRTCSWALISASRSQPAGAMARRVCLAEAVDGGDVAGSQRGAAVGSAPSSPAARAAPAARWGR